jgi:hypothetical protein
MYVLLLGKILAEASGTVIMNLIKFIPLRRPIFLQQYYLNYYLNEVGMKA